jgi:hypothetical protein
MRGHEDLRPGREHLRRAGDEPPAPDPRRPRRGHRARGRRPDPQAHHRAQPADRIRYGPLTSTRRARRRRRVRAACRMTGTTVHPAEMILFFRNGRWRLSRRPGSVPSAPWLRSANDAAKRAPGLPSGVPGDLPQMTAGISEAARVETEQDYLHTPGQTVGAVESRPESASATPDQRRRCCVPDRHDRRPWPNVRE